MSAAPQPVCTEPLKKTVGAVVYRLAKVWPQKSWIESTSATTAHFSEVLASCPVRHCWETVPLPTDWPWPIVSKPPTVPPLVPVVPLPPPSTCTSR